MEETVPPSNERLDGDADMPDRFTNGNADSSLDAHFLAAGDSLTSSPILSKIMKDVTEIDQHHHGEVFDQHISGQPDAPRPPKYTNLPYATLQTGLVYDVRMRFHVESEPAEDDLHPEDPRRIHAIFEAFVQAGLAWRPGSTTSSAEWYMGRINTRVATEEEICLVHTKAHYDWVQHLKFLTPEQCVGILQHPEEQHKMDSVYMSPNTPYCAALSVGGAIEACRSILLGKVKNAFAVIRPPGHHAEREDCKGFCFFDNVSIATKVCQREFPETCKKVLILDWDVHHGNGIQQAHYDNPDVLYISLHVFRQSTFYPEGSYRDGRSSYGDHIHCGTGAGLGKNINIPWSELGMGDADYIYAFQQVVMPVALEFNPDLVIIAAGFDAAEGDMLGGCHVSPAGYAHMTHMLMSLAKGKLAVCLEGGYNLDSIARSATAVAQTLMGEAPARLEDLTPTSSGLRDVKLVVRQQSKFWRSLLPKDVAKKTISPPMGIRMHSIIRQWQAQKLWDEYQMSPLYIPSDQASNPSECPVLATPDWMEIKPLLVMIHDPPDMVASPDPIHGRLEHHNTWLIDATKSYMDTAIANGFAVIDINIPKYMPDDDDSQGHQDSIELPVGNAVATEMFSYVFNNYIEPSNATNVFVLGTDAGHAAITNFVKGNEDLAVENISKTLHFVQDISLQTVRSATNDELSPWYYRNSLVFLRAEHNFWKTEFARRPKKKFGDLRKSDEETIGDMLMAHKDEVFQLLLSETEEWRMENVGKSRVADDDAMDVMSSPTNRKLPPISNFALPASPRGTPGAVAR